MTELLSQAYTDGSEYFKMPHWMRILIRDVNDPFHLLPDGRTGGVNIIDLANYYSCSFIATDDLGVKDVNKFKILRSEEHTSELQSRPHLVCRLLLEKKKTKIQ